MSEIEGRLGGTNEFNSVEEPTGKDAWSGRRLRRHLAAGVVGLTTVMEEGYRAATINTCGVASLDPFLITVSIELESQMDEWLLEAGRFAVSILPWRQKFFADQFAGFTPLASPTFSGIDYFISSTGCPILANSIAWADCLVQSHLITGDHRLYVGQVEAVGAGKAEHDSPLVYYLNRYVKAD
jgi:flavin reductase (DIM6/NTAB) family NADH-FMN oxidoreductase RutF